MARHPNIFTRHPVLLIAGFLTVTVLLVYFFPFEFIEIVDYKTIDLRFQLRAEKKPGPEVVLAAIDEKSLDQEGRWVWPRSKIAALIDRLSEAGARVVAFDIGFNEPDDQRVILAIERIQSHAAWKKSCPSELNAYLEEIKTQSDNDRLLATAIQNSKAKVVLGWFFHKAKGIQDVKHLDAADIQRKEEDIRFSRYQYTHLSETGVGLDLEKVMTIFPEPVIRLLSEAAGYTGYFNFSPDMDGITRRLETVLQYNEGKFYAPLSLMALSAYFDLPLHLEIGDYGQVLSACIGDRICIPTDGHGRMMINFRGEDHLFPYKSVTDILHGRIPAEELRDKIVIVGATAVATGDIRATPFSATYPGPEIHATVIDSILAQDFLYRPEYYQILEALVILVCGLFLGFVLTRAGVVFGAVTGILLVTGYVFLGVWLFAALGMVLSLVYPVLTILLVYMGVTAYKYFVEEGKKRFIQNTFSKYLAPTVVKQLIESPDRVELGGEQRDITAFFSDVQGFTSISESMSPTSLVELLNEFLTEMTDIILRHEGTVDKFEGDAIIAFFGAPNVLANHARTATVASLEMQARLVTLRTQWREKRWPEMNMRIGLCSGPAVVGNMGSKNRMDYTMMGDTVNTAARLEGVNKVYGVYILIGDSTRARLEDQIICREIDSILVVGKQKPITIYEPLGFPENVSRATTEMADLYARGLSAYRSREWQRACDCFQKALEIVPQDGPSKTMLRRAEAYQQQPPPADWSGAFSLSSK
ncbi:MAG: CHASE2 domain-containing protein [Thermodesulfobacteriota bacterium]